VGWLSPGRKLLPLPMGLIVKPTLAVRLTRKDRLMEDRVHEQTVCASDIYADIYRAEGLQVLMGAQHQWSQRALP
jgi:hypothetical protein